MHMLLVRQAENYIESVYPNRSEENANGHAESSVKEDLRRENDGRCCCGHNIRLKTFFHKVV